MRVMTFNILHSAVKSLAGPWKKRRDAALAAIRSAEPDILCLQEVSETQLEDLSRELPGYQVIPGEPTGRASFPIWIEWLEVVTALICVALTIHIGRSESTSPLLRWIQIVFGGTFLLAFAVLLAIRWLLGDFLERGERCPLLLRRDRLSAIEHGTIRVPPGSPAGRISMSPMPHIIHWVRVKQGPSGEEAIVCNTHLGFLPRGRRDAILALENRFGSIPDDRVMVFAGDFNAAPQHALIRELLAGTAAFRFHDTWAEAGRRSETSHTVHGGTGARGPRIDYVLVRPRVRVWESVVLTPRKGERAPSDHYPLLVTLDLASRERTMEGSG